MHNIRLLKKILFLIAPVSFLLSAQITQAGELIQNGGFETGNLAPWTCEGHDCTSSQCNCQYTCGVVSDRKHSGSYSAKIYARAKSGASFPCSAQARLIYYNISLPADVTTIDISWWQWGGSRSEYGSGSTVYVVGTAVGNLIAESPQDTGKWEYKEFKNLDVSDYAGQDIQLTFLVIVPAAVIGLGNVEVWMYIDDVSVTAPTAYIDVGLRVYNSTGKVAIAAWPLGEEAKSPLRIAADLDHNGTPEVYGIVLIDPTESEYGNPQYDSGVSIKTNSGIKALRKLEE